MKMSEQMFETIAMAYDNGFLDELMEKALELKNEGKHYSAHIAVAMAYAETSKNKVF